MRDDAPPPETPAGPGRAARALAAVGRRLRGAARRSGLWSGLTAAAVAGLALLGALAEGPRLDGPSILLFDRFHRLAPRPYDPETPVRVIAVDGASLDRFGQWPWPRTYFVELLDRLEGFGAAAVAFDILFADPDRTSPELAAQVARRFDGDPPPPAQADAVSSHDALFARRIAALPVVLGGLPLAAAPDGPPAAFPFKIGLSFAGSDPRPGLRRYPAALAPLAPLIAAAAGYGLTGVGDVGGGVVRRAPMLSVVGEDFAPSLAFEALRVAQGARGYLARSSDASGEASGGAAPRLTEARVGRVRVPLTADGALWLRYAGPAPARVIPAWRVLEAAPDDAALAAELAGRILLVGATAPGLRYVVDTPLGPGTDGVLVHAEALEQMLAGAFLWRPDWALGAEALAIAAMGLLAALLIARRGALAGALTAAGGVAALTAGSWIAFSRFDLMLSPVWPAAALVGGYVALTALNYFLTARQSRAVRSQFERFVAPAVIRAMVGDQGRALNVRGEMRPITLLFVDARGFTGLSEAMPPETLIDYLNAALTELSDCVLASGGTVDKYMGDCVMAFWNAPLDVPGHEARAVETLFAMRAAEDRLNAGFAARGLPALRLGMGVNAGVCNVGLMGSPRRLEYSCIGDAVNIASRLQDLTKPFGVWNCVGESVISAAPGWRALELDVAPIRGRRRQEAIWTVLGPETEPASEAEVELRAAAAAARAARDAARHGGVEAGAAFEATLSRLAAVEAAGVDGAKLAAHYRASLAE